MSVIFYIFIFIFLLDELGWIFLLDEKLEKSKNSMEFLNSDKVKNKQYGTTYSNKELGFITSAIFKLMLLIGIICGIFTVAWVYFLIFIISQIILSFIVDKLFIKYGDGYRIFTLLNSIYGAIFATFILINKYHLHYYIDITKLF